MCYGRLIIFKSENSYASNGVKHCIRPCDMTGKSAALILRQMHPIMIVPLINIRKKQRNMISI
jgi:hypothetical protein